ncbi:hypothetical protein PPL_05514 [Heterostelium album PN500]|uniref:Uncharacterized protein n=1 Tax=Heterostelium pallidum (strain ATCC 26659 / Pp 5 / PN500) TaxID=670386 RepID=D3BAD8_HETP5|nr:hypothetical protein PPL_05514 [Heterostelium album PN500]EFA81525.1 hypothetical protein PPL_05514 [Heterostelium album PN500]|eukprot:XP_020433642.1 hypothetical protein PPL_05514 [Heterostelium album PN500]
MKNIFRRSVQIFHKKDKDKSGNSDSDGSSRDSSRGGSNNDLNVNGIHSGSNSSKKDKKSKRHSKNYDAKHSDVSASSESPQSSLRGSPAIYSQKQQQQQPIPQVIVSKPSARRRFASVCTATDQQDGRVSLCSGGRQEEADRHGDTRASALSRALFATRSL